MKRKAITQLTRKGLPLILLFLFLSATLEAQNQYKIYTGFMYHFIKYTQFPSVSNKVVVGVYGKSGINSEAAALNGKPAGSFTIAVKEISSVNDLSGVNVLFVPSNHYSDLPLIVGKAKANKILIVTESSGATKSGSVINFFEQNNKINFEISNKNATAYGLRISSDLLKLAKVVD